MIQTPDHLYTRQADIARIEALVQELPDEAVVELHLFDGGVVTGTVSMRPSVQVFRDADGNEGFNAVVRIEDRHDGERTRYLWMDCIASVVQLGSS